MFSKRHVTKYPNRPQTLYPLNNVVSGIPASHTTRHFRRERGNHKIFFLWTARNLVAIQRVLKIRPLRIHKGGPRAWDRNPLGSLLKLVLVLDWKDALGRSVGLLGFGVWRREGDGGVAKWR